MPSPGEPRVSRLLIDEPPIAISPSLSRLFGLPKATLMQQVHYRCTAGISDREGRWTVVRHCSCSWVSWTPAGMIYDIPLGRTLAPHRLALGELRTDGIVKVEQLAKSRWNRANFYRIDYETLELAVAQLCTSPNVNPQFDPTWEGDGDEQLAVVENAAFDISTAGTSLCQIEERTKDLNREREGAALNRSTILLRRRLMQLVGRGPKDNQRWDHKRVGQILATIESQAIEADAANAILDGVDVRYLSQVEKRVTELVRERKALQRNESERAEALRLQEVAAKSEAEARIREENALRDLAVATEDEVRALADKVAMTAPIPSIAQAAREAVAERQLGTGMVRALVLVALKRDEKNLSECASLVHGAPVVEQAHELGATR